MLFNKFYQCLKPILFLFEAERAHSIALSSFKLVSQSILKPKICFDKRLQRRLFGLTFPNPIGLAAGLDKNGDYIDALAKFGFGFIEVGTVTPKPQPGNPKPRLFRLKEAHALINRFGFNSKGLDYLIENLKKTTYRGILGVNIGKNYTTELNHAVYDYLTCLEGVYPYAHYITVNISSPNTPELRNLQTKEYLNQLLDVLNKKKKELEGIHQKHMPLLVKVAPDLNEDEIKTMAASFKQHTIAGVIATNTTISREGVEHLKHAEEQGGLSGDPLFLKTLKTVELFSIYLEGKIPIIACGGISNPEKAKQMLKAGASLLQCYTGLIYEGPDLVELVAKELCHS